MADDFEHHRSLTRWYLRTPDGRFEVYFVDQTARRAGSLVRLTGVTTAHRIAASTQAATGAAPAGSSQQCSTIGTQKIAVLMVTTPSNPAFPAGITAASLGQAFFGSIADTHATDSLNGYWGEMSYGLTSAAGQVFGPFALNQNYTCDQSSQILTAAVNAADPTVDFTQFSRIALMFPVQSCSSYSGMDTVGCMAVSSPSKGDFPASIGWFPQFPNSQPNIPLYVHELGHGLGLSHSSTEDYDNIPLGPIDQPGTTVEYGDLFSLMGYPYNGHGISGQYAAQHKSLILHWLQPGDYQEIQSSGTFTLAPYESSSGLRALRVLRDPATGAWLWLEYRQPIGDVDKNLQGMPNSNVFNGALIHYEDPALGGIHTYLLDFNPVAAPNDFRDGALTPGRSWSDPYSSLTLTVNSATSSALSVTVNYAQPSLTVSPRVLTFNYSIGGLAPAPQAVSIANANAGALSWSASSSVTWLIVTPTSGTAPSTISVSVNPSGLAAGTFSGSITIAAPGAASAVITATLSVVPPPSPPIISLSKSQLAFSYASGGSNPHAQTVSISNSGAGTLSWSAASSADWLSVTPASGTAPSTISVSVDPSGLAAGTFSGSVTIAGAGATSQAFTVTLTVILPPNIPGIAAVTNAADLQTAVLSPATWAAIKGVNLAPATRMWDITDFVGNKLPTQLNGVSVTVGGRPCYILFISPTQIYFLPPDNLPVGQAQVQVVTPQGNSPPVTALVLTISPAFFMFDPEGRSYLAAVHADGTYVGKPNLFPGLTMRPAKPGDIILLFGTGFGPTNPTLPAGELVAQPAPAANQVTVRIGGVLAQVAYAGVVASGEYQFNVTVPEVPDGDHLVVAEVGGLRTQGHAYITVQR